MVWIHIGFFLSGLTGLIYEILWTRMTAHLIGAAPYSVSLVLSVFMGGLGLGALIGGRLADSQSEPRGLIKLYCYLEVTVGSYALVLPKLFALAIPLCAFGYRRLHDNPVLYHVFLFLFCAVLLLPPVLCMGATLPILCRRLTWTGGHWAARLGYLYGLNTAGAALGALLCGFWFLETLGLTGTGRLAAALNALVAVGCWWGSRPEKKTEATVFDKVKVDPMEYLTSNHNTDVTHAWQGFPAVLALGIFALSGFCAMACEVIWTRLLGLVLGPTPYAFTLVLFTFILGLALGNLLFGKLADLGLNESTGAAEGGGAWHLFALTQALAAILILVSSQLLGNGPVFFSKLAITFRHGFWAGRACEAIALSIFMFPPAIAFGASFPLLVRMGFHPGGSAGRYVGRAFAINTLGGVLGALGAGLILVPWLGKEISISLVAGLQGLGALALALTPFPLARVRPMLRGSLAILALASLSLAMVLPRWDRLGLSRSAYYDADPKLLGYGWLEALFKPHRLISGASSGEEVYYGDGIGGFTTVWKTTGPLGDEDFTLFNSGKADASAQADMFTQALCAHFPLTFHPHPRSVMVLGLASGITAGEVLNYPVDSLDILEINRQVVGASRFFLKWNKDVISQPKTRLILQDGKAHLLLTDRRYDVIISEPSNPWMAGLSELYSLDFFTIARSKLDSEGMFVQFLHSYQMDWATFSMVGRTFAEAFPNSYLIRTLPDAVGEFAPASDYLLIGIKGTGHLDRETAEANLHASQGSTNVTLRGVDVLYKLIESDNLKGLFGEGPIHTDDVPALEFAAPKLIYADHGAEIRDHIHKGPNLSVSILETMSHSGNAVNAQLDFAAYAMSVFRPFPGMVDLTKADREQRAHYESLVTDYCTVNSISDFSVFAPLSIKRTCVAGQVKALQQRLITGINRGPVLLAMASLLENAGEPLKALPLYQMVLAEGGDDPSLNEAARVRIEALKISDNPNF